MQPSQSRGGPTNLQLELGVYFPTAEGKLIVAAVPIVGRGRRRHRRSRAELTRAVVHPHRPRQALGYASDPRPKELGTAARVDALRKRPSDSSRWGLGRLEGALRLRKTGLASELLAALWHR